MTHNETTQMMCRSSMWRGFAEKVEDETMSVTCSRCQKDLTGKSKICVACVEDCAQRTPLEKAAPQLLDACKKLKEELIAEKRGRGLNYKAIAQSSAIQFAEAALALAKG